jgi:hypothetical protein
MKEMTIEEAISHCLDNVKKEMKALHLQCALEHLQLAEWLISFESYKSKAESYDRLITNREETIQGFIEKYWDKQVTDFHLRIDSRNSFYIHPDLISGDTVNFEVCGNSLKTICYDALPDEWREKDD